MALTLSIFTLSINTLLDFTTALTTPWVSHVYPAVVYWNLMLGFTTMTLWFTVFWTPFN